jgi:hypothetical protein
VTPLPAAIEHRLVGLDLQGKLARACSQYRLLDILLAFANVDDIPRRVSQWLSVAKRAIGQQCAHEELRQLAVSLMEQSSSSCFMSYEFEVPPQGLKVELKLENLA